jgi:hypothetical protein
MSEPRVLVVDDEEGPREAIRKAPPWASTIFWLTPGPTSSSLSEAMASGLNRCSRSSAESSAGRPVSDRRTRLASSGTVCSWIATRPSAGTR